MRDGSFPAAFGRQMREHLARAGERNATAIQQVVGRMLDVVEHDGRIHVAGTGHSVAMVLEGFFRAGGLACVSPIVHAGLIPLLGGQASTVMERSGDLAPVLVAQAAPESRDLGFVFSNSGVNPLPVGIAQQLRAAGVPVVAVCSLPHLRTAAARADVKLDEAADHVLDTGVPYGDAVFETGGGATAALSSLTSVYLWNLLLAGLATSAADAGVDLPLWTSANIEGGDERNAELMDRFRPRIPTL
jgi:uncharacterized phosphosugar-binding protein